MMTSCSLLLVMVPWLATGDAAEIAEIEERVLAGRRALTQAHMVFESSIVRLKDGEQRPLDIVRTFYLDGEKVRCDKRRRYDQQEWFIRQPYDPKATYYTVKRCFSEDQFFLYSDRVYANGKKLVVRVTERERALKIQGYRVPDLRHLGLTPDTSGCSGVDPMEMLIRAPDREELSISPAVEQGEECQRIEFVLRGMFVQVWVAPSMGYSILRHRKEFDVEDTHYVDDIQLNVREHKESGIWFPVSSHYRRTENGRRTREERLKVTIVSLNEPLDPRVFTLAGLDIPVGRRVMKHGASPLDYLVWDGDKVTSTRVTGALSNLHDTRDADPPPNERLDDALEEADRLQQHVLVIFLDGSSTLTKNWFKMRLLDRQIGARLADYQLVEINVRSKGAEALTQRFGVTLQKDAFPVWCFTNASGKALETGQVPRLADGGGLDRGALLETLTRHAPERLDARGMIKEALAEAAVSKRRVIVQETATWCGPCHMLARFLEHHRPIWEKDYLWIRVDQRWHGSEEVMNGIKEGRRGGIPWFAILDSNGEVLATSEGPDGNIGFPSEPASIDHFLTMFRCTKQRISENELATLRKTLESQ